ncbi:MAG: sodium:proton antiporter [Planctomycetales bacterium]|nr:sodium:proton antiporter [Planctomycetales bacterium]
MNRAGWWQRGNTVVLAILALALAYGASLFYHLPQGWTEAALGHAAGAEHAVAETGVAAAEAHGDGHHASPPPYWTVVPFIVLLGCIAVLPLMHKTEHWWEENINRFKVAAGLGLVTLAYYAFFHHAPIEAHWPGHAVVPATGGVQWGFVKAILGNAILQEYIPFIVLLFSLYVIAGGVRIQGDLTANPITNASFMAVGGLLASFIGTTGAAMVLIRPLLETNRERKHVAHTVIFFIFIVCNCGGCLLPIGDPPLFLGYLNGVDFTWTLSLWKEWVFVNGAILVVYTLLDHFYFHRQETIADVQRDITQTRKLQISGLAVNGPLLLGVVLAVALLDPSKAVPGTGGWHPPMYLREVVQLALVAASLQFGSRQVRKDNNFNYAAIIEVAALFVGIFICMQPALQILNANGADIVEKFKLGPAQFFWATGALSSFLDNAPTYLVFFQTAQDPASALSGAHTGHVPAAILSGISLGSVFMGAMTYIGNGPNFMVKAIAEKSGVKMPSFFGYMMWSCCVLLPIMAAMNWLFLAEG